MDEKGSPMRGVPVEVYVERTVPHGTLRPRDLRALNRAISIRGVDSTTDRVTLIDRVATNESGEYESQLNFEGDAAIYSWVVGCTTAHRDLGEVGTSRVGIDLVVTRREAPRFVLFTRRGIALRDASVLFADMSARIGQPSPGDVRLDQDGRMRTDWFICGHTYYIQGWGQAFADDPTNGFFDWSDQATIDLVNDVRERQ